MGWYDDHVLPQLIDLACGGRPIRQQRAKIVPAAAGDVVEIGFGSGLNLPYYDSRKVRKIWGLEPSAGMQRLAAKRIAASVIDIELIGLPGEDIPLESDSADTVLVTYTLCSIPEVRVALEEMRRVLKPQGRLLFCEHGAAPDRRVRRWQERINPAWRKIGGGCNVNRDIPGIIESAGFSIVDDNRMYIPGLRVFTYNFWGAAEIR